ncbi:DUF998 domain-containing protein [Arthrobacter sp. MMS18-M83]|uniref:DUF998 domain-containing protein n=1 Tax=Arthrobacter sp. MMS18-M83 TaxID=2996261 RepID=UPI00227A5C40|nr:DUF998 domain-containing protein [Arthrobacter sp. MMS18-M83]WAH97788.1 DUF998 domain-containing protein [Arthrobacter sp. MMS18-M83]
MSAQIKTVLIKTVEMLDSWSEGRRPSPVDSRHMIGSWAAKSLIQYFAIEYIVHLTIEHYSYWNDVVSKLGALACTGTGDKFTCHEASVVTDLSFIGMGIGVLVAACLITSTVLRVGGKYDWFLKEYEDSMNESRKGLTYEQRLIRHLNGEHRGRELTKAHKQATVVRILLGITGIALIGIGAMPDDFAGIGHNIVTGTFVVTSLLSMIVLADLWRPERRKVAAFLDIISGIGIFGGVLFGIKALGDAYQWSIASAIPIGITERLVIYGFIVNLATMGFTLSSGARRHARRRLPAKAPQMSHP